MSISFLTTKFYIPSPPREFVSRPRLIELLNVGLHRKLTLISASAGFGKTTLLSEWIHRGKDESPVRSQVAWLSLDDDDNDSIRFWSYFIAALQTIRPGMGKSCLALLDSPDPPPVRSILTILINALNAQSDTIVIILDDYHSITAKSIHETLTFFLDHSPPQVHLVIASRIDPPLPLSRLRGKGQLNELRTTELRFNVDETTAFLNEIMKLDLSENDVMALESRVEGWIASLQMTALSLQGRKNIPDFIKAFSGSHHYIMDYLAKEVLQRQDEETRSFLLKTSTLNLLCGPLCDALTHQNDGQERLEDLASANLFLTPSDDERRWFRYHHLFADLLRSQLNRLHPDWVVPLQQEASEWFEREGMVAEAIHHSLAIPDYERAATLIESIAVQTINESRLIAPRSWLAKLPNELVLTRPWLCLSMATVRLATGKYDEVEPLIDIAEALLEKAEMGERPSAYGVHEEIRSHIMALKAILACVQGDVSRAINLAQRNLELAPKERSTVWAITAYTLGRAYWMRGDTVSATRYLNEGFNIGEAMGNFFLALASMGYMADIQGKKGRLREAAETNREAIRLGTQWGGGEPLPATTCAYLGLAQVLYQWNEIDEAIQYVTRGIELARQGAESTVAMTAYPILASLNELQKRSHQLTEALDQARQILYASRNVVTADMAEAWVTRMALANGNLEAAKQWAASMERRQLNLHSVPDCWQEFAYLTLVRLYIAQGEADDVPEALDRLRHKAEAEGRMGSVIEMLVLQAIALQTLDRKSDAVDSLARALSIAEPEGYVRIFIDEGQPMIDLLNQAIGAGIRPEYAKRLLAAFDTPQDTEEKAVHIHTPSQPLGEPLTTRELEVLRMIAAGKNNRQIADELFVVIGTVKTHINSSYRKLSVHSRTQAVARATELGLLQPNSL